MLDIKFIEQNPELVMEGAKKKGFSCDINQIIEFNRKRKEILTELEQLKAEKNRISKLIPTLQDKTQKEEYILKVKSFKDREKELENEHREVEEKLNDLLLSVPNPPAEDTPIGKDESGNVEYAKIGTVPEFDFQPKDHMELGAELNLFDFERASRISGSRTYFLKNQAVFLQSAVLRMTMDYLANKGFTILYPPYFVKRNSMIGTGYFPFGEEQAYSMEKDELYLIGTSEVPLVSFYQDEILEEPQSPILFAGVSTCFRREAGTYGKDTKGLYRIHQFEKIEQVILCKNNREESDKMHAFLLKNAEEILQMLELPYRLVKVCTGDLGAGQVKKDDIEVWMPSRNSYGETHSCSSFYDYQTRRSNIRFRGPDNKLYFPYSLNNTAIASPRILIPLLEIHQQKDGAVKLPKALIPYMNGMTEIRKRD